MRITVTAIAETRQAKEGFQKPILVQLACDPEDRIQTIVDAMSGAMTQAGPDFYIVSHDVLVDP